MYCILYIERNLNPKAACLKKYEEEAIGKDSHPFGQPNHSPSSTGTPVTSSSEVCNLVEEGYSHAPMSSCGSMPVAMNTTVAMTTSTPNDMTMNANTAMTASISTSCTNFELISQPVAMPVNVGSCLLYTSDAADE